MHANATRSSDRNAAQETTPAAEAESPTRPGLEGVSVADTELAHIDGTGGRLLIRGVDVETLAGHAPFEAVCNLLWNGRTDASETAALQREIGSARCDAHQTLASLGDALEQPSGMDALRAAIAHLRQAPGYDAETPEGAARMRVRITGAAAVFAAAWARLQEERLPIAPSADLSHAADTLRLFGLGEDRGSAAALDAYLATVAEHGMCASTFTARVVASTDSDDVSAIVAAIGALKGPLHGGAPGPVLDMLDAIAKPEHATAWLEGELAAGRRIMGMGHRVYRVRDPRAAVLERAIGFLEPERGDGQGDSREVEAKLTLARTIESEATRLLRERHPDRPMAANVEFYTAILLDAIGLRRELFTPTFAVARVAGWLAHTDEQRRTGRIIRPTSRYIGPLPEAA